ncbi:MAG: ThiF family adenylyltransferase, partial [Myxococcales bacterium]|nr:ThiF family adenylyltransferase [Myxococcales bacterium]
MSGGAIDQVPVAVLGAGGLGCPALLGLRMAGARRITIVDHDRV